MVVFSFLLISVAQRRDALFGFEVFREIRSVFVAEPIDNFFDAHLGLFQKAFSFKHQKFLNYLFGGESCLIF